MGKKNVSTGTLTVTGEGQVKVKPDVAHLRLGVLTEGKTANDAVTANAVAMTAAIDRIREVGVDADAISTVGLGIYPVLSYEEGTEKNRIIGYRAEDTIQVDAPIELAGKVFDAAVEAGVNESSNISFGLKDESADRRRALEAAVRAARSDAEIVTKAMGVDLQGVQSIDIEQGSGPVLVRTAARFEKSAVTPVMGGDVTVSARVRVVFAYYD